MAHKFPAHWHHQLPEHRGELLAEMQRISDQPDSVGLQALSQYVTEALLSQVPSTSRYVLTPHGGVIDTTQSKSRAGLVGDVQLYLGRFLAPGVDTWRDIVSGAYRLPITFGYCVLGHHPLTVTGDYGVPRVYPVPNEWLTLPSARRHVPEIMRGQQGVCEDHYQIKCRRCASGFKLLELDTRYLAATGSVPQCNTCCQKLLMFVEGKFSKPGRVKLPKVVPWETQYAGPEVPAVTANPFVAGPEPAVPADLLRVQQQMLRSWRSGQVVRGEPLDPPIELSPPPPRAARVDVGDWRFTPPSPQRWRRVLDDQGNTVNWQPEE